MSNEFRNSPLKAQKDLNSGLFLTGYSIYNSPFAPTSYGVRWTLASSRTAKGKRYRKCEMLIVVTLMQT